MDPTTIQMVTGFTITILSSLVYSTLTNAFISGGSFRSKKEAVVIVLGTAFVLGIMTPSINTFWEQNLEKIEAIQLVGCLIIMAMIAINQSVKRWKHTTKSSMVVYGFGIILILWPLVSK